MVLTEAAFILWVLNCLIVAALAHFVGWLLAGAIVAGGWMIVCTVAFVAEHFLDRRDTRRGPLHETLIAYAATIVQTLCILAAILIFPVVYFGILAHGHYENKKAARAAAEHGADAGQSDD
ncbi:hypothetical protein [Rhizobium sp. BK176]|uniref:hypothetical protein n=1 Tax=Rhizobium sp. BK176 TaxID=2587071 RepID=UPI00216A2563|nr:hypothetical protein [Rhizobium sp. BK176]MCS4089153.1 hypothetical protein [Rhizobium sp. BK176]